MRGKVIVVGAVVAVLVGGACTSTRQNLIRQADEAAAAGNVVEAAQKYRFLCTAVPADAETCAKASSTEQHAIDRAVAAAQARCAVRDVDGCLTSVAPVRALWRHPSIDAVVEQAGQIQFEACAAEPLATPEDALSLMRCATAFEASIATPRFSQAALDMRARAGAWLGRMADERSGAGQPGAAYVLNAMARCFVAAAPLAQARTAAWDQLRERSSYVLAVDLKVSPGGMPPELGGVCSRWNDLLPSGVLCATGTRSGGTRGVSVQADVTVGAVSHAVTDNIREIKYKSGVERTRNPEYDRLQAEQQRERRDIRRGERDVQVALADCESAKSRLERAGNCGRCYERSAAEQACNRADALRDSFNDRVGEFNQGAERLGNTDQVLERDVIETFRYVEHHHRWERPYSVRISMGGALSRPAFSEEGVLRLEAKEHVGFPQAGLAPAPLKDPTPAEFNAQLVRQIGQRVTAVIGADVRRRGTEKLTACGQPSADPWTAWLDCWAQAFLWSSGDPAPAFSSWLAQRMEASRNGRLVWPQAACRP